MKKFDTQKTIQLIVLVLISIAIGVIIFLNKGLYHTIATDPGVRLLCIMLWLTLAVSFLFIYLDFNIFGKIKHDYSELDQSVHSDHVAGIANRASSDALIEKYLKEGLPERIGCIMFELTNLKETNSLYGRLVGNQLIHDFSSVLKVASTGLCFVSRNGGNRFLAIFDECDDATMDTFLQRVQQKVYSYNIDPNSHPIQYEYGISYNAEDDVENITDLISLADSRITSE